MKKVLLSILLGMAFLISGTLHADAKMYILKPKSTTQAPHTPKMPAFRPVIADIDAETGELTVMFRTTINSAEISISQDGVIYENDNINAVYGQTVVYDMSSFAEGDYMLLIATGDDVIAEFTISIEEE